VPLKTARSMKTACRQEERRDTDCYNTSLLKGLRNKLASYRCPHDNDEAPKATLQPITNEEGSHEIRWNQATRSDSTIPMNEASVRRRPTKNNNSRNTRRRIRRHRRQEVDPWSDQIRWNEEAMRIATNSIRLAANRPKDQDHCSKCLSIAFQSLTPSPCLQHQTFLLLRQLFNRSPYKQ